MGGSVVLLGKTVLHSVVIVPSSLGYPLCITMTPTQHKVIATALAQNLLLVCNPTICTHDNVGLHPTRFSIVKWKVPAPVSGLMTEDCSILGRLCSFSSLVLWISLASSSDLLYRLNCHVDKQPIMGFVLPWTLDCEQITP